MKLFNAIVVLAVGLSLGANLAAQPAAQTFPKAKLNLQVGDKKKEIDASVSFDAAALVIVDKNTAQPIKTMPYASMKGAEYSFAKSPRWKTALLVSPLFLFTSGKKHWFMVQTNDDYALVQLDKSNYKMVIAAFEIKTGKKVETVADTK